MDKPENYKGPEHFAVPHGYIDVTSPFSNGREGIPGPDQMLHRDVFLILRLMIRLHSRGYDLSFGEIQERLKALDDARGKV